MNARILLLRLSTTYYLYFRMENSLMETSVSNSPVTAPSAAQPPPTATTVSSTVKPKMASGIPPPSPLKILREDSVDGTLSPVSSKSTGTDTDTDTRKKVPTLQNLYQKQTFSLYLFGSALPLLRFRSTFTSPLIPPSDTYLPLPCYVYFTTNTYILILHH